MKWWNKHMKGFRTWLVATAFAVIPILQLSEVAAIVPDEYMDYYTLALVIAVMWMRAKTTTALGKSS